MAAGYDLSSNHTYRLMKGRLGVYDKRPFNPDTNSVDGVEDQSMRLRQAGGNRQQERMIKDKRRSLDNAVWYSYQGAEVVKTDAENRKPVRALINPNKLKQDYDDKIISVGYEYDFAPGTIFEWLGTNTYWLVYLQDLTELAYFRGDIRKCSYEIKWEDEDGNLHQTYAAIRGPVETKINFIQKHGISVDSPNHSLNILMPKTEATLAYFKRYKKFYLQGDETCWRVEATDWISMPGVLEVVAVEYFANEDEDDIEAGIIGGLLEEIENPNDEARDKILGETFIKVKTSQTYEFNGTLNAIWSVEKGCPVTLTVDPNNKKKISLKWEEAYSGQFDLYYGKYKKTIVVESLF